MPEFMDYEGLPDPLKPRGFILMSIFGVMSFVSATCLFLYITYRMVMWKWCRPTSKGQINHCDHDERYQSSQDNDLSLGLSERHYGQLKSGAKPSESVVERPNTPDRSGRANGFLILIYHLLFADIWQSLGYLLSLIWARNGAILASSATCWAQGWFLHSGKLASNGFLVHISITTYLTVVRGWLPPKWVHYCAIAFIWVWAIVLPLAGALSRLGGETLYDDSGASCWISLDHRQLRIWLDFFWVYVSVFLTALCYIVIYISLHRNQQSFRHLPYKKAFMERNENEPPKPSGYHPAFAIYPMIYMFCTMPLAISRLLCAIRHHPSAMYQLIANVIHSSQGLLNVVLWSTTIIFIGSKDIEDTGLDRFAFMRTPRRQYGHQVWVQGGSKRGRSRQGRYTSVPWWRRLFTSQSVFLNRHPGAPSNASEESLRRSARLNENGIQMEIVTTVVVENEDNKRAKAYSVDSADQMPLHSLKLH